MTLSLDTRFAALADPTRRAMLARLARGETTITELAAPFPISQPAISRHVRVLERAGLIVRRPGRAGGYCVPAAAGDAFGSAVSSVAEVRAASCVDELDSALADLDRLLAGSTA